MDGRTHVAADATDIERHGTEQQAELGALARPTGRRPITAGSSPTRTRPPPTGTRRGARCRPEQPLRRLAGTRRRKAACVRVGGGQLARTSGELPRSPRDRRMGTLVHRQAHGAQLGSSDSLTSCAPKQPPTGLAARRWPPPWNAGPTARYRPVGSGDRSAWPPAGTAVRDGAVRLPEPCSTPSP